MNSFKDSKVFILMVFEVVVCEDFWIKGFCRNGKETKFWNRGLFWRVGEIRFLSLGFFGGGGF